MLKCIKQIQNIWHWRSMDLLTGEWSPECSDMRGVEVSAVYAPVWGEVSNWVALQVFLHSGQAAAELQANSALVRRGPAMCAQVLDHGRVVPWTLATQTTLKGFLSCVHPMVCVQLMFQAESLGAAFALVGLLSTVAVSACPQRTLHPVVSPT